MEIYLHKDHGEIEIIDPTTYYIREEIDKQIIEKILAAMQKNIRIGDIDIDCMDRSEVLSHIDHVAARKTDGAKHPTGVYVQDISIDPLTGNADFDYDKSDYTKVDFLNLSTLSHFKSNEELSELISKEPNWDLLKIPEVVEKLPHIHQYYNLIQQVDPKSVEDLMMILDKIREHAAYKFKRSHSLAYSLNIIAILNYFEKTDVIV